MPTSGVCGSVDNGVMEKRNCAALRMLRPLQFEGYEFAEFLYFPQVKQKNNTCQGRIQ